MVSNWLSFVALAAVLVAIPGPAATLTMKNAVARGFGSAITTAAGVAVADFVWIVASVAGLTAILVASEPVFLAVRILGAIYLGYIGLRLLLARHDLFDAPAQAVPRRPVPRLRAFREGVICDLSNPKALLVFTSVIPQFLHDSSTAGAVAALGLTFTVIGFCSLAIYAAVFAQARRVTGRPVVRRFLLRVSGAILVAFGVRVAFEPT
jgi:threonine/homoserine/homoserine lactone efflux protein